MPVYKCSFCNITKNCKNDLRKHLNSELLRFAVNQEYIAGNIDLNKNDEIAIFPPVSGG